MGPRFGVRRGGGRADPPGGAGRWRGRRTPPAAEGRRHPRAGRALRNGAGHARRARRTAGVRRQQRRPLLCPGVRSGAGPVLRDGLPPPRHGRADQRAARREDRRHRHVHPHDGLAPGRRTRVRPARAGHAGLPRRLQRGRERLPRRQVRDEAVGGVHRARARRSRLQAAEVVAGGLARLVEGDGVGPGAETWTRRSLAPGCRSVGHRSRSTSSTRATPTTVMRRSSRRPTANSALPPRVRRSVRPRSRRSRPYAAASTRSPT